MTGRQAMVSCAMCCLMLVVHCLASQPDLIGTPSGCNAVVAEYDGNEEKRALEEAKLSHIRQILTARLHSVLSGTRARDFEKWVSRQGDLKVVSMHGVDEVELHANFDDHLEVVPSSNGLFPDDAINLALVPIPELPSQYQGRPFHLEEGGISVIDLVLRSIRLGFNFAPVASTAWLALVSSNFREKVWFSWVASCLAASGPAFIKWGQWASTRSDMFPESLCAALSQLTNDAPTHSWKHTKKVMESSLGIPPDSLLNVFDSFDEKPLASGSIAQIHKACLDGIPVVAKVRHPNVAKLIDMDFRLMRIAALIADYLPALSWLHIRETVEQFSHTMAAQAHLNVEGHHLEVLNYNFRNWNHVGFPRPFYATSAVIIETFESGQIVTSVLDAYDTLASQVALEQGTLTVEEVDDDFNLEDLDPHGYQVIPMNVAKFIVSTGLSLYLKMLLIDRQMHADLHAGNIMLDLTDEVDVPGLPSTDTSPSASSRSGRSRLGITLVDAGMVAQLSEDESTNFIGLLCSLGDGNGRVAAQCTLRFSKETLLTELEQMAFADDMDELFQLKCRGYGTNVGAGEVLRGVLGLIRKHKVRIDANYATLVVNCLCIEGLAQRVCPSYNLVDAAKPLLQAYQGLCYNKKDGALVTNPSSLQKGLVRLSMPLAYLQKSMHDNAFFSRQVKKNRAAMA